MIMKPESNKPLVLRLTGMSDESYEITLYERAFQYLEHVVGDDEEAIQKLGANPHFWSWWVGQWERRNRILLHRFNFTDHLMVPGIIVRQRATTAFDTIHEVSSLNILINRHVMRSTFQMVCTLTDTKLQTTHPNENQKSKRHA